MIRFKLFAEKLVSRKKAVDRMMAMRKKDDGPAQYDDEDYHPKKIKMPSSGREHADKALDKYDKWHEWEFRKQKERTGDRDEAARGLRGSGLNKHFKRTHLSNIVSSPSRLDYGQPHTDATSTYLLHHKAGMGQQRHIRIVSHTDDNGRRSHAVVDGHHALVGAIARGHNPRVHHIDLDKKLPRLKRTHPDLEPTDD